MAAADACRAPSPCGSSTPGTVDRRNAPAVSTYPSSVTMKAPSMVANSLMVSSSLGSRTFRRSRGWPLKGFRIICSECSRTWSASPMTNVVPTGLPSRPSLPSCAAMARIRSNTSGRTPSVSFSPSDDANISYSPCVSMYTISSRAPLSAMPVRQTSLSPCLKRPSANPSSTAILIWPARVRRTGGILRT